MAVCSLLWRCNGIWRANIIMNNIHKRRLYIMLFSALGIAIAAALILYALRQNINAFMTPTEIAAAHLAPDYHCRLGGLVKKGSLVREKQGLGVQFVVTDMQHDITVRYTGILPDLFREGKGMIGEGTVDASGDFNATRILAKHDENYTPQKLQHIQGKS